jgi:hypothetical protein
MLLENTTQNRRDRLRVIKNLGVCLTVLVVAMGTAVVLIWPTASYYGQQALERGSWECTAKKSFSKYRPGVSIEGLQIVGITNAGSPGPWMTVEAVAGGERVRLQMQSYVGKGWLVMSFEGDCAPMTKVEDRNSAGQ